MNVFGFIIDSPEKVNALVGFIGLALSIVALACTAAALVYVARTYRNNLRPDVHFYLSIKLDHKSSFRPEDNDADPGFIRYFANIANPTSNPAYNVKFRFIENRPFIVYPDGKKMTLDIYIKDVFIVPQNTVREIEIHSHRPDADGSLYLSPDLSQKMIIEFEDKRGKKYHNDFYIDRNMAVVPWSVRKLTRQTYRF